MSLAGNLRTMALPEILQWVSMGRKTGSLVLERGALVKKIMFESGLVVSSWSNDPREYLGQILVRLGLISEEKLFRALLKQETSGSPIGRLLIDEGALSEADLRRALTLKAEETVYDLFLWRDGQFELKELELPTELPVRIAMEVTSAVLEGARREDEWARIHSAFGSMDSSLRLKAASVGMIPPRERQALGLVAQGKSLAEIALLLHASEFEAASLVFELQGRGLVELSERVELPPPFDLVARIRSTLDQAAYELEEGRHAAALSSYEQVLKLDRLNQLAKKGLIAAIEGRNRERLIKTVPLDKIPAMVVDFATLTREKFEPQEGFVLSRVNGQWDVRSILKLCPMAEEDALLIFARLLERKVIDLV